MSGGDLGHLRPVTEDHDTANFWTAARRLELVVKTCLSCSQPIHLPMQFCAQCGGQSSEWRTVRGLGRLHSWSVVAHEVHPSFPVPYTLVLVELEDPPGVRFVGSLAGTPELSADQLMEVTFDDLGDGVVIPNWTPVGGAG